MRNNLSAGRVQSVAVRMIAEREREINAFTAVSTFRIEAFFTAKDISEKKVTFKAEGAKQTNEANAEKFLQSCIGAKYTVADIQVKPAKKSPAAPFTTSTLQQEAGRKLGYGVSRTMMLAQKLYESGNITYMRTDSVNLSDTAVRILQHRSVQPYGKNMCRRANSKIKMSPHRKRMKPSGQPIWKVCRSKMQDCTKLYELIWKRTMASQMADAELEKTTAKININQ